MTTSIQTDALLATPSTMYQFLNELRHKYSPLHSQPNLFPRFSRQIFFFIIIFNCIEMALAQDFTSNRINCLALRTTDKTYLDSSQRLMRLNSVATWTSYINKKNKHPALGQNVDRSIFKNGRCFWSISLYESDEYKLQLWREYLVEINGGKIVILNPSKH